MKSNAVCERTATGPVSQEADLGIATGCLDMDGEAKTQMKTGRFLCPCFVLGWPRMDDSRLPPRVLQ